MIQREIGAIKKDATNPYFKSKYFDINSLLEQVKPVLNKHGVVLMQGLNHIEGKLALTTTLRDADGMGEITTTCPLPEMSDPQKAGSAITYFRRYALQSLLALEAEDDDANLASNKNELIEKKPYVKVAEIKAQQIINQKAKDNGDMPF